MELVGAPRRRVLLFTDSFEPSGMGEHMLALGGELGRRHSVSFTCRPTAKGASFLKRAGAIGLDVVDLDWGGGQGALCSWLADADVDVFHGHAGIWWEGHDAIRAAHDAGLPAVVRTEHLPQVISDEVKAREYADTAEVVDRLICVSHGAAQTYADFGVPEDRLRVVHNGIAPGVPPAGRHDARHRLGLPAGARIALTVGRLTGQKGHRHMLAALPAILARAPDLYWLVVGDGPDMPALRTGAHQLGVEQHVVLAGQRPDVSELMASAELFVLPSLFEGLPIAVLEAMTAGLPVVGTDVCGTSEVVVDGETGRLVPAECPDALAGAVLDVLLHPDEAVRWGRAGQRRAETRFSVTRMAAETEAVYEEALARRSRLTTPATQRRQTWHH